MAKLKGSPKTGGRVKGTPNRSSGVLFERLYSHGCDPVEEIVKLLPQLDPEPRARVLLGMLNFLFPRKAPIAFNLDEMAALTRIEAIEASSKTPLNDDLAL